jgi:tRNA 5-methylaminomethyl-2-thiouridine biosynthesis bifunctional protein
MKYFDVIVIGGGLAGASAAFALSRRGARVMIVESMPFLGAKASGNALGLLSPYYAYRDSPLASFYTDAFRWSRQLVEISGVPHFPAGAIQLPSTRRLGSLLDELAASASNPELFRRVSSAEASELAGAEISTHALYAARATHLRPTDLIHALVAASGAFVSTGTRAAAIAYDDCWKVTLANGSLDRVSARCVVLCGAYECASIAQAQWLPLEPIRGQTALVRSTSVSSRLRVPVCFDGYITPARDGLHLLGAHYRHGDDRNESSTEDTESMVDRLSHWLPSLHLNADSVDSARVCFRTSTIDRLPYIGRVPDFACMRVQADRFQSGTSIEERVPVHYYEGLYISAGHGSRGLLSCPYAGEIIARLVYREPLDEHTNAASIVDPSRTVYKLLKRGECPRRT